MREPMLIFVLVAGGLMMLWLAWRDKPIQKLGYERRNGMRAEVFRGKDKEWRFKIIADNNEPVAQSEGYKNRSDAVSMAEALVGEENVMKGQGE